MEMKLGWTVSRPTYLANTVNIFRTTLQRYGIVKPNATTTVMDNSLVEQPVCQAYTAQNMIPLYRITHHLWIPCDAGQNFPQDRAVASAEAPAGIHHIPQNTVVFPWDAAGIVSIFTMVPRGTRWSQWDVGRPVRSQGVRHRTQRAIL